MPTGSPQALLWLALALGMARTLPLTWTVPALGGPRVGPGFRLGLAALLAILGLPVLLPAVAAAMGTSAATAPGPWGWVAIVGREVLVGVTTGFVATAAFRAAEVGGRLIDTARGSNLAELLSPDAGDRGSPFGELYSFLAILLFLEMGGLRLFASAIARGYEAVPIGGWAFDDVRRGFELAIVAVTRLMESAVSLAAPVLVAMLLADLTMGIVGRALPGLPLYFAIMPAKALLGLGVTLLGIGVLDAALVAGLPAWMNLIERALEVRR